MSLQLNKRLLLWLSLLLLIAIGVFRADVLQTIMGFIHGVMVPIYWALGIAYLLNSLLKTIEKWTKLKRGMAVLVMYLAVIVFLTGVIMVIVPIAYNSLAELVQELPNYASALENWVDERISDVRSLERFFNTYNLSIENFVPDDFETTLSEFTNNFQSFVLSFGQTLFTVTSSFFKFLMGLILSIYILLEKETYGKQISRIVRAYTGEKRATKFFDFVSETDEVFSKYIIGKALDSLVIAILCFIGLSLLHIKFPVLFAIFVGITNMVPYFGPIVGAIPIVFVTVFYSPLSALWAALFMLALQQVDGNFIGPLILGDRVGISPMMIIIAVIIGGGLFGVPGMLLGVPVVAVIRNIIERRVARRLGEEKID